MSKALFCIVNNQSQAEAIVNELQVKGFSNNDISVLLADNQATQNFAYSQKTKAPEGGMAGVGTGGILGGALGWLAGIGALSIPGIGPFIAAGPIMAALSGVAIGGALGGITGCLIGMGIPEYEAKRYEGKIRRGNILISVHTEDRNDIKCARKVFEEFNAQDIASTEEASVPHT